MPKIQLLTIWLGANDATFPGEVQHVPMYTYMANLSKMIRMIKDPSSEWYSPETRVVIITPPPVNGEQWLQFLRVNATPPRDTLDRNLARSRLYAQAARDVAKQEQVPVADVWTPLWEAAGEKEENLTKFLSDGLHLNMEGYKVRFRVRSSPGRLADYYTSSSMIPSSRLSWNTTQRFITTRWTWPIQSTASCTAFSFRFCAHPSIL